MIKLKGVIIRPNGLALLLAGILVVASSGFCQSSMLNKGQDGVLFGGGYSWSEPSATAYSLSTSLSGVVDIGVGYGHSADSRAFTAAVEFLGRSGHSGHAPMYSVGVGFAFVDAVGVVVDRRGRLSRANYGFKAGLVLMGVHFPMMRRAPVYSELGGLVICPFPVEKGRNISHVVPTSCELQWLTTIDVGRSSKIVLAPAIGGSNNDWSVASMSIGLVLTWGSDEEGASPNVF